MKIIETPRLVLRPWRLEDAPALYAYAKNPNVGPNAGWKPHESLEESEKIIRELFLPSVGEEYVWAIVPKDAGVPCGSFGLEEDGRRPGVPSCRSLGYVLGEEQWGKGYMTEAARAVLRFGFEEQGLGLITVNHFANNRRSRRVIEKCGFSREGVMRGAESALDGTMRDLVLHSMTRAEWEAARRGTAAG